MSAKVHPGTRAYGGRWYHRCGMTRSLHPRTQVRLLLAASLALVTLAACKPGGEGTGRGTAGGGSVAAGQLAASVAVTEPVVGGGVVTVTVREGDAPVRGASVEVQGDMTHAGMVPVIAAAAEVEPGVYRAAPFGFSMAGDWIVTAEVETPDGRKTTAEAFVTVAR